MLWRPSLKAIRIFPVPLGIDRCYIIRHEGVIMIDGGFPGKRKEFVKALERIQIKPEDIGLILLTHGHWDHIGSAKDIKDITGAPIALHQNEKEWLEKSLKPLPPGLTAWGRIFCSIMAACMPLVHIPATKVDVPLTNESISLAAYGIPGKIFYTPGHSSGSVSVLLETGDAFVGDLAMNALPMRLSPGFPILGDDMSRIKESWKFLIKEGARKIYPAHGKPFPIEAINRYL
jgi:hydroxyacylglutathione hydrolase